MARRWAALLMATPPSIAAAAGGRLRGGRLRSAARPCACAARAPTCSTGWSRSAFHIALIIRLAGRAFGDPLPGESAALDVAEHLLHPGAGLVVDDSRAGDEVAVFGRLRDEVEHLGEAAFVHQVDDQLQLVQALEVGDLRLVAGVDQGLESRERPARWRRRKAPPARRTGRSRSLRGSSSRSLRRARRRCRDA